MADLGLLSAGPRYPQPLPSTDVLRAVLHTRPRSQRAAEHQLLALADWLLDTEDAAESGPALSAEVAHALGRIENDLTGSIPLRTVAAESGLSYDALRRRFVTELGQTSAAFRTARRLQAAATLLGLTDMTHRERPHSGLCR